MVNFWLVPNELGFPTIRYPAYMVNFCLDSGYMVNFWCHWGRFTRLWVPLETVDAVGTGLAAMRAFRWPKFEQNPSTFGWDAEIWPKVLSGCSLWSWWLPRHSVYRIYGHSGYMVNFSWSRRWRSKWDPLYHLPRLQPQNAAGLMIPARLQEGHSFGDLRRLMKWGCAS